MFPVNSRPTVGDSKLWELIHLFALRTNVVGLMFVLRAETFVVVRPDKSAAASCHLCSIILYIRPDSSSPTLRRRTSLQLFLSVVLMGTERS